MDGLLVFLKLITVLVAGVLPVEVTENSGRSISGDWTGIGERTIRIQSDGGVSEIAFEDLLSLVPTNIEAQTGPTFSVMLVGGSRVAAEGLSTIDTELLIEPRRQSPVRIPLKQVKAIRFRAAGPATDAAWLGLIQKESRGDTLVIRRPGDRLDPTPGVIVGIADGKVKFDLDGDVVDAPIDRLEGVIFGGTESIGESAAIRVTDVYGSTWAADSIATAVAGQPLRVQLTDGIEHEVLVDQVASIRWSGGLVLLAGTKPADSKNEWTIGSKVDAELVDAFFQAAPTQDGDLVMHGGTSVEYRIEPGYTSLVGTVMRDPSITQAGNVEVRILIDGKSVWRQPLPDGQPRGFELDVASARRLTIQVDAGDDGDLGDTVKVVRPRLLK